MPAAEGADVEVCSWGETREEEVQCGADGGNLVVHASGAVDDEDEFWALRGEGEFRGEGDHEG